MSELLEEFYSKIGKEVVDYLDADPHFKTQKYIEIQKQGAVSDDNLVRQLLSRYVANHLIEIAGGLHL